MKLMTCKHGSGEAWLAALVDNKKGPHAVNLARLASCRKEYLPHTMLDFIEQVPCSLQLARKLLSDEDFPPGTAFPKDNVDVLAPIPRPRKNIIGIGLNYVKHVAESAKKLDTAKELPKEPVIFSKPPTTVIGYGMAVEHNAAVTQQLDWEIELGVVIGRRAKHVSLENAMDHVFGYLSLIDISARDCRRSGQWIVSKGQDTFAPMGPVLVTADEITDPHNLELWLKKNGEIKQQGNTKDMLFKIDHLIEDISSVMTLDPGDIIATGTPDGVGAGRTPQEWLWPGDVLEAGVENLGNMYHPIIDVTNKKCSQ